jgi:hypothetical protein
MTHPASTFRRTPCPAAPGPARIRFDDGVVVFAEARP